MSENSFSNKEPYKKRDLKRNLRLPNVFPWPTFNTVTANIQIFCRQCSPYSSHCCDYSTRVCQPLPVNLPKFPDKWKKRSPYSLLNHLAFFKSDIPALICLLLSHCSVLVKSKLWISGNFSFSSQYLAKHLPRSWFCSHLQSLWNIWFSTKAIRLRWTSIDLIHKECLSP